MFAVEYFKRHNFGRGSQLNYDTQLTTVELQQPQN